MWVNIDTWAIKKLKSQNLAVGPVGPPECNYLGGGTSEPTTIFWLLGAFYAPYKINVDPHIE